MANEAQRAWAAHEERDEREADSRVQAVRIADLEACNARLSRLLAKAAAMAGEVALVAEGQGKADAAQAARAIEASLRRDAADAGLLLG